MKETTDKNKI